MKMKPKTLMKPDENSFITQGKDTFRTVKFTEWSGYGSCARFCAFSGSGFGCMKVDCFKNGKPEFYLKRSKK